MVIIGDAVVTPGLIAAAEGADLLLQDALSEKVFLRDFSGGTAPTEDGMMFELPAGNEQIIRVDP